jgi:hypothetical protein
VSCRPASCTLLLLISRVCNMEWLLRAGCVWLQALLLFPPGQAGAGPALACLPGTHAEDSKHGWHLEPWRQGIFPGVAVFNASQPIYGPCGFLCFAHVSTHNTRELSTARFVQHMHAYRTQGQSRTHMATMQTCMKEPSACTPCPHHLCGVHHTHRCCMEAVVVLHWVHLWCVRRPSNTCAA